MAPISRPINVALVGVGLAGQVFHAPLVLALPDLFKLHTVVERAPKSARGTIGEKFNVDTKIANKLEDALNDPEIELVVIGTPSHTHFEVAKVLRKYSLFAIIMTRLIGCSGSRKAWCVRKSLSRALCSFDTQCSWTSRSQRGSRKPSSSMSSQSLKNVS